ncbi:hypothetical protein [Pleionea sediminis]|uniref:hypothetical protein n=1 Tax=Pleionea sediminis TaxID=2569479 RepID=UPI001184E403|nr:hypothetical protein [Pleionea sediminis]
MTPFIPPHNRRYEANRKTEKLAKGSVKKSEDNAERINDLEKEVEKLSLVCESLSRFIEKNLQDVTLDLEYEIDETTKLREQRRKSKNQCIQCSMLVPSSFNYCMYCGASLENVAKKNIFDRI